MFLMYLNPLPVKAHYYLYSWMRCAAVKRFAPGEIGFIGAPWQLQPPSTGNYPAWVHSLVGDISDAGWDEALKIEVPEALCRQIADDQETPIDLLRAQALEGFQSYRDWLYEQLLAFRSRIHVEAIITSLNCKSLADVAGYLRIPVIHEEAGNIRQPAFRFSTKIFDFNGANGNSEFDARFRSGGHDLRPVNGREFIEAFGCDETRSAMSAAAEPEYEVGVALQVEDDSNIVAYSNGWNSLRLLYKVRQVFPAKTILVRSHPLSIFDLGNIRERQLGIPDTSASAIEFICKCKRILTINSSVAFEAILAGKATYILGDSPMASMAYRHFDRHVREQMRDIPLLPEKVGFYAFNYMVPLSLWLDPDYYRFRLSHPPEDEIRRRHLEAIERTSGITYDFANGR